MKTWDFTSGIVRLWRQTDKSAVTGWHRARCIKPKFPEIPVQNQMERNISKTLFRKFRSTSRGCPFFRKLGNTGNFLFHLPFHHQIDLPDSPRRFLVNYPSQKGQYLLSGAMNGRPCGFPTGMRPVWITPWQRSSHVSLVIRKRFLNSWARGKYLGIVASK